MSNTPILVPSLEDNPDVVRPDEHAPDCRRCAVLVAARVLGLRPIETGNASTFAPYASAVIDLAEWIIGGEL